MKNKQAIFLLLFICQTFGRMSSPENNSLEGTGLMNSPTSDKVSNVLRDILNQESLVRFSMVQKMQGLFMDAIDNKNRSQILKKKLSDAAEERKALEKRDQRLENENIKLKQELKTLSATFVDYVNLTMENINSLNESEILFLKRQISLQKEKDALENKKNKEQLDVLKKGIGQLDVTYNDLRDELHLLKNKDIKSLKKETLALDHKYEIVKKKYDSFPIELDKLNKTIGNHSRHDDYYNSVQKVEASLQTFSAAVNETLENIQENQQASNNQLLTLSSKLLSVIPERIAFHAIANSSTTPGVIIFDHLITNIGGGYDSSSGIFTVPRTGLYVFSWTIETHGQLTEGVLLVNGLQKGLTKSDQASSYYDTTTSFAVLNLKMFDKVWVKIKSGRAEAMHTMFSGWKTNKIDDTGFYAYLSRDVTGSTIAFDNEILDTDNAYSTSTGKFVAPRFGLYVFMMSALIYGKYEHDCKFIFSSGLSQPPVWVDSSSGLYDSSSYMTFAWMNFGEHVRVNAGRMGKSSVFAGWELFSNTSVTKSTYPAFLASLGREDSSSPVIFNKPHSGYRHGYSTSTGIFTADRDGVYLFLFNTEAESELVRTTLRVNGVDIFETRSDGRHSDYDDTSAVSVLQLSLNDRVSVGVKYGTVDDYQSLFFGILLFEI